MSCAERSGRRGVCAELHARSFIPGVSSTPQTLWSTDVKSGLPLRPKRLQPKKNGLRHFCCNPLISLRKMVGVAGFELATPCTPCKCATRLRYTPTRGGVYAGNTSVQRQQRADLE